MEENFLLAIKRCVIRYHLIALSVNWKMSKSGGKVHPGAIMFGNALAAAGSSRLRKSKPVVFKEDSTRTEITHEECSRQIKISEEGSIPVFPGRPFSLFSNQIHLLSDIDNSYQESTIPNDPPDEYSLPLTQSHGGFNMSPADFPNPQPFPTSTYNNTETCYYTSSLSNSPMDQWGGVTYLLPAYNPDVYAFNMSNLTNGMSADSRGSERVYVDTLSESFDYNLPLTPQDSGCLSSEDGNSSDTSVKDYEMLISSSYYHTVNSCEIPKQVEKEPEEQPKVNPATTISGRVSKRSISRVQGPTTSLSTVSRTTKNISIPRKSLPFPSPQYIPKEFSDDSGAEVSTDEDLSPQGCGSCEKESEMLFKADEQKRWRLLPDYSRLDFLNCKSSPGFIDSHCHLDFLFQRQNYDGTYADYMLKHRDSFPVSYEGCVAVFCNPRTFHRTSMWEKYLREDGVWAAFGCHPHNANVYSDLKDSDLLEALKHPKVRALGECGLDYSNRNDCSKEKQFAVLRRQLKIALSHKLPVVIHCRDANGDLMRIMKEILPKDFKIHLHCFTDGWDWAQRWLAEFPNLFIGITNLVTYNSAQPTHDVVKRIPLDRLLLETDAPYFIPRMSPRSTKYSHPGMAIQVAAQIAMLRSLPLKEIIHRTRQNTNAVYGI